MQEDMKTRKRSPNWENKEKILLRECIKQHIDIIENKSTDTNTNKKKIMAWQSVGKSFNELNDRDRTINELKQQWRIAKINAKKENSAHKRALKCTGGGEKPPSPSWETAEIITMIPQEFTEEFNIFDSDQNQIPNIQLEIVDTPPTTASEPSLQPNVEVTHATSGAILRDVTNKLKQTRKQKNKIKVQEETANEKVALQRKIQEIATAEHEIKMKYLKESHEWAQEIFILQKKEAELKINNLILKNALLSKQMLENE